MKKKLIKFIIIFLLLSYWSVYATPSWISWSSCPPWNYLSDSDFQDDLPSIIEECELLWYTDCEEGMIYWTGDYTYYKWNCKQKTYTPVPSTFSAGDVVVWNASIKITGIKTSYADLVTVSDYFELWTFNTQ